MVEKKIKPATTAEKEPAKETAGAEKPVKVPDKYVEKSGKEKDSNLLAALGYPIGIIAIIMYLTKKEDKFLRFHSLQAILFWVAWVVIWIGFSIVSVILAVVTGGLLGICSGLFSLVLIVAMGVGCLYPAWKAYQGEEYELPVIGEITKKHM